MQIGNALSTRQGSAAVIADKFGVSHQALYKWRNKLTDAETGNANELVGLLKLIDDFDNAG